MMSEQYHVTFFPGFVCLPRYVYLNSNTINTQAASTSLTSSSYTSSSKPIQLSNSIPNPTKITHFSSATIPQQSSCLESSTRSRPPSLVTSTQQKLRLLAMAAAVSASHLLQSTSASWTNDISPSEYGHTGSGTTHGGGLTGSGTTTSGPHHSNIENKIDPRVDSGKSDFCQVCIEIDH